MRIIDFSFCSSDPCFSPERPPKQDSSHDEKPSLMAGIVENMKSKCLWRKKKKKQQQRHKNEKRHQQPKMANSKDLALGKWFPKSPTMEKKSNCCSDEDCGSKHRAGSACVSYSGEYSTVSLEELLNSCEFNTSVDTESACYSDSRDFSFSLEKLLKNEKKVEVEEMGLYSFTRSQSSKEKKVSFRLPEVSDIIILNSPVVDLKE